MKLIVKNAHLVDQVRSEQNDILLEDGIIRKIGDIRKECSSVIDATGMIVMPAFVDMHSHFRTPGYEYKEDFLTGFHAALKGGYGTVCGMANTMPVMDRADRIAANQEKANSLELLNYIQIGALGLDLHDKVLSAHDLMRDVTPIFSNDGNTIENEQFMREALKSSSTNDFVLCTHCQPEEEIIERDLRLLTEIGGNLHICHISTEKSLGIIGEAKKNGMKFTCEVTPHHLFGYGLDYKVNPPFAAEKDVLALIAGIRQGVIDVLATDHAPHSKQDKENGAPGIDNIEVAFGMYWSIFHENNLSLNRLSEMISGKPASLLGLRKGRLKEGYDADLVFIDPDKKQTILPENFVSKSNNTPFAGKEILGKVLLTMIGGKIKYDSREVTS
ncbi:MAG: dihydroorotase [Anaerofustis sp.]